MKKKNSKNTVPLKEEQKRTYKEFAQEIISRIEPKLEICPDITAGYYKDGKLKAWFSKKEREKHKDKLEIEHYVPEHKTIVIVLESSHTKEYADENFINPALGKTGENLQNYFEKVLKKVVKKSAYRIILMNSIQFQCSLGLPPECFRDHIWLNLWISKGFKENFIKRLEGYHPDIIFNFCTQGEHSGEYELYPNKLKGCKTRINKEYIANCLELKSEKDLPDYLKKTTTIQALVSYEILNDENFKNTKVYIGLHPSSWKKTKDGVIKIKTKKDKLISVQLFEPKKKDTDQETLDKYHNKW